MEVKVETTEIWIKTEFSDEVKIEERFIETPELEFGKYSSGIKTECKESAVVLPGIASESKLTVVTPEFINVASGSPRSREECPKCDHTFKNKANLKNHLKYVHSSENDAVECEQCLKMFKSLAHLRSHRAAVHAPQRPVACTHCTKTFLNKKKLDNHMFYSHPKSNAIVICDICKKDFKHKYSLRVHIRQVHPAAARAERCEECGKLFKSGALRRRHVQYAHPPSGRPLPCHRCARVLPSAAGLRTHLRNVHAAEPLHCSVCRKPFKSRSALWKHGQLHRRDSAGPVRAPHLPCARCGLQFSSDAALTLHFDTVHSAREMRDVGACRSCGKTFGSAAARARHVRDTHAPPHAARPCTLCGKTFKCAMHLRVHVNVVHARRGRFACQLCDKEFSSKKYLQKHEKTHVDSKQSECAACGKWFQSAADVKKHAKRVHGASGAGGGAQRDGEPSGAGERRQQQEVT